MKTIPLREVINTKGKHEIGISAYNLYGESPQAITSVDIAGIPFTIDTEEVSITDINGNPLTEILSCGQTIVATVNISNKQLPDEIVIDNITEFEYVKSDDKKSAVITITGIKGDINFIFGELIPVISFNVNAGSTVLEEVTTTAITWQELIDNHERFIIYGGNVGYIGPDCNYYNLIHTKTNGTRETFIPSDNIRTDISSYTIDMDIYSKCNFYIRKKGSTTTLSELEKPYGKKTFAQLVAEDSRFYCDEAAVYYVNNGENCQLTRNNIAITPEMPITSGYYYFLSTISFTLANQNKSTFATYTTTATTWTELAQEYDEFEVGPTGTVSYLAPNKNTYTIVASNWAISEQTQSVYGDDSIIDNEKYKVSWYVPKEYGVFVMYAGNSCYNDEGRTDGPITWKDYIAKHPDKFTSDEQGYVYFKHNGKQYLFTYHWKGEEHPSHIDDYVGNCSYINI